MDHASDQSQPTLYAHKKRREWGRAFLLWERNEKRGYLFEDGQEKVLARGFYGLMEEVQVSMDEYESLRNRLGVTAHGSRGSSSGAPALSFEEQLQVFRIEYSGGFQGDAWQDKLRGKGRRIKRHRSPAVADAQERLSATAVKGFIAQQQYRQLWETACSVLKETDLVAPSVLNKLSTSNADHLKALAETLAELLYGADATDVRMDRFVKVLRLVFKTPSWQLATGLLALVAPEQHLCVRPTSLRDTLRVMAPGMTLERWPSGTQYMALLEVCSQLKQQLEAAGEAPRDFLDIYDFLRLATRPAARQLLANGGKVSESAPSGDVDDDDTEAA